MQCFAAFVGRWKVTTPQAMFRLKRDVDQAMYATHLLFSPELLAAYRSFTTRLFAMYATVDGDALIRPPVTSILGDRRRLPWWTEEMTAMFAKDHPCSQAEA
jgi:hypothetical protein